MDTVKRELQKMEKRGQTSIEEFMSDLKIDFTSQLAHVYRTALKAEQAKFANEVLKIANVSNITRALEDAVKKCKDRLISNYYVSRSTDAFDNAVSEVQRDACSRTLAVFERLLSTQKHKERKQEKEKTLKKIEENSK